MRPAALLTGALALAALWTPPTWAVEADVPRLPEFTAPTSPQLARINDIAAAALESPTAAKILSAAAQIPQLQGLPVSFVPLRGNELAHFDYVSGALALDNRYRQGPARAAVPTFVHELVHVLQQHARTPAESLERELEAHALTLRVLDELGLPADGSFAEAARAKLKESPAAYVGWMREQLPSKLELSESNFEELADDLEQDADRCQERIDRLKARQASAPSPRTKKKLAYEQARLSSILADVQALRSGSGRKRYLKFSRKVKVLLAREHARLNGR